MQQLLFVAHDGCILRHASPLDRPLSTTLLAAVYSLEKHEREEQSHHLPMSSSRIFASRQSPMSTGEPRRPRGTTLSSKTMFCICSLVLVTLTTMADGFVIPVQRRTVAGFRVSERAEYIIDDDDDVDTRQDIYIPPDFTIDDDDTSVSSASSSSYDEESTRGRRRNLVRRSDPGGSWMDRNQEVSSEEDKREDTLPPGQNRDNKTFRQNFRGTRVFVQGLPKDAGWQELKDHFRIAGQVVFASVSSDRITGESKGHGIVQFETTEMAQTAIAIMRNHPLDGHQLFVREDVQEKEGKELSNKMPKDRRSDVPRRWECANEANARFLDPEERRSIISLIKARDDARRRRNYESSDRMRAQLEREYSVRVDDRLKMWWVDEQGGGVPQAVRDAKGEGSWDAPKEWRQIPTTRDNDACVDPNLVNALLKQRDIARREKDFATADALLNEARDSPDGDLYLRIHDESRTWRIWTDEAPAREVVHRKSPEEQCIEIVAEHAPEKVDEVRLVLEKFPGREYQVLKKLKQRYLS